MKSGWVGLHDPERGDLLGFMFDPAVLPFVGIWINRGGWGGYEHLAIEPTNGRPDALDIASGQWHSAGKLKARQRPSWDLGILCTVHKGPVNHLRPDGGIS